MVRIHRGVDDGADPSRSITARLTMMPIRSGARTMVPIRRDPLRRGRWFRSVAALTMVPIHRSAHEHSAITVLAGSLVGVSTVVEAT